jgi:hypothetical protein
MSPVELGTDVSAALSNVREVPQTSVGRPTKRLSHEATGTVDVHDFTVYESDCHQHKRNPRDFLRRTDALARQLARNTAYSSGFFASERSIKARCINPTRRNGVNANRR